MRKPHTARDPLCGHPWNTAFHAVAAERPLLEISKSIPILTITVPIWIYQALLFTYFRFIEEWFQRIRLCEVQW